MATITLDDVTAALEGTRVTPSGISFEGKSLKLDTEEDAKVVVNAITNSTDMEFLNLEGNTLGVEAARAIAKALEKHSKFKRALWKDMFTGRMKTEIPKALQYLGDGLVAAGARLTELDLSDNAFGPIGVQGLASLLCSSSCYALEELRLNNNGLGITGGKLLATALLDCYNSSSKQGKPLALKVFIAGRNRLENEGAKALALVFKTIGTLEEIAMPQNGIYHVGISALSDAFTHNKALQILNLNDNTIGAHGAEAIANALPNLQRLKQINFGDCLLKTKGALSLANGLRNSHAELEELVLGFNEIHTEGGLALVDAMANKIKLKVLVLDGNQFNEAGRDKIKEKLKQIDAFTHNKALQILNLNDNTIGAHGAEAIANALPNLQRLKQINFGDCLLKTKGALSLANGLRNSHAELEELVLGFNEIHTEGGLALVDAMANKIKLKVLVLDGNQFNEAGRDKIKEKLKQIGKFNVLGSLDDCDSEEEEEGSEESGEESEDSESDGDVKNTDNKSNLYVSLGDNSSNKVGSYDTFIKTPSAENFLTLGSNREDLILTEVKKRPDLYLDNLIPLLMKVSALTTNNQEQVAKSAQNCSELLYKELFAWAETKQNLSLINNALLVHLGLIKSEDKKFKPSWNIEGCLFALENITKQNFMPETTKDTLRAFMGRQVIELNDSFN